MFIDCNQISFYLDRFNFKSKENLIYFYAKNIMLKFLYFSWVIQWNFNFDF